MRTNWLNISLSTALDAKMENAKFTAPVFCVDVDVSVITQVLMDCVYVTVTYVVIYRVLVLWAEYTLQNK